MNKTLLALGVSGVFAQRGKNRSGGGTPSPQSGNAPGELNVQLLADIVKATQENQFVYTSPAHHTAMVAAGLVEVNPQMADDKGQFATRATAAGVQKVNDANSQNAASGETSPATGPDGAKPSFTVARDVPMPTAKRGGRSGTLYPFDSLEVGQSFFVAATNDKPNPAKSLASTVSSATARYAEQDGTKEVQEKDAEGNKVFIDAAKTQPKMVTVPKYKATRKFEARSVEDGGPWGQPGVKGAGVWRTQ